MSEDRFAEVKAKTETILKRRQICYNCEEFNSTVRVCNKCWCFIRLKTVPKRARCPIGKW